MKLRNIAARWGLGLAMTDDNRGVKMRRIDYIIFLVDYVYHARASRWDTSSVKHQIICQLLSHVARLRARQAPLRANSGIQRISTWGK